MVHQSQKIHPDDGLSEPSEGGGDGSKRPPLWRLYKTSAGRSREPHTYKPVLDLPCRRSPYRCAPEAAEPYSLAEFVCSFSETTNRSQMDPLLVSSRTGTSRFPSAHCMAYASVPSFPPWTSSTLLPIKSRTSANAPVLLASSQRALHTPHLPLPRSCRLVCLLDSKYCPSSSTKPGRAFPRTFSPAIYEAALTAAFKLSASRPRVTEAQSMSQHVDRQ